LSNPTAHQISAALNRGGQDDLREAAALLDSIGELMPRGDELARLIFNVAFHCEALCDDALCGGLYRRSLDCPVTDINIHAGCWFRLGGCLARMGSWKSAMECFQQAIRLGSNWPHMTDQAALQLAELLCAAEDFEAAERLLDPLRASPIVEIRQSRVRLARAKCLVRLGRMKDAVVELEFVSANGNTDEELHAERTMAEIHEASGNRKGAVTCYERILKNPGAENALKAAASFRIESLR
jgi:tetratricopeptide (TPR) repeat protein